MIEISPVDIRRAAMDMLARREHSRLELTRKLGRKFSGQTIGHVSGSISNVSSVEDLIEEELLKLRQEGVQSDARLAEVFIRARTGRGQGLIKIRMELKGRGVSEDDIALAFEACSVDWYSLAHEVAVKKFGDGFESRQDRKEKSRLSRFLQQRGFSYDHISSLYRSPAR